jgi:hypothetical protein
MSGVIDHVNLSLKIDSKLLKNLDLSQADDPVLINLLLNLSNGTGAGQASQHWHDTRSLAGSATEDLDLAASLTNAFGVTLTFTKVKLLYVRAATTNNVANNVNFQRATANGVPLFLAALDGVSLAPGAIFLYYDPTGVTVTAATGDLFTVTNSAGTNTVSYDIFIAGAD